MQRGLRGHAWCTAGERRVPNRSADRGRGSRRGHRVGGPPLAVRAGAPRGSRPLLISRSRRVRKARASPSGTACVVVAAAPVVITCAPPPPLPSSGLWHSRPFPAPLPALCDPPPPPFRDHHPLPRRTPTSHPGAVYTLSAASRAVHVPPSYGCCGGPVDALAAAGSAPLAGGLPVNGDRRGLVCDGGQDRMRLR